MYKYELEITGMMCSMCESHINDVIRKNFNAKKIKSNHKKNLTTFMIEDLIDEAKLNNIIVQTGYKLGKIKYEIK
jgi:copper chaperone CopZ